MCIVDMKFRPSSLLMPKRKRQGLAGLVACLMMTGAAVALPSMTFVNVSQSYAAQALSDETIKLFAAIRAGDLGAVQDAVVAGADMNSVDRDNLKPVDLAESLKFYSITYFLKAYQNIDGGVAEAEPKLKDAPNGQYADEAGEILQKLTKVDDLEDEVPLEFEEVFEEIPTVIEETAEGVIEIEKPLNLTGEEHEEEDFFAETRVFGAQPEPLIKAEAEPEPEAVQEISNIFDDPAVTARGSSSFGATQLMADPSSPLGQVIPEHERLRDVVLEKLRLESENRMETLRAEREKMAGEIMSDERAEQHLSGTENIQAQFRSTKRAELTGELTSPGYVPPPDGGNSAVRFLQRLGLLDETDNVEPALTESQVLAEQLSAVARSGGASPTFVDRGYSAPPAGQAINTKTDNSVAIVGQMTRMFSPTLPDGTVSGNSRLIDALSGQIPGAPQFSIPPEMAILSQGGKQNAAASSSTAVQPAPPIVVPYSMTDETWDVAASMGSLSTPVESTEEETLVEEADGESPVIGVLANVFGPQAEPSSPLASGGSWDVVAVNVAPSAGQMMLGLPTIGQNNTQAVRPGATPATPLVMGQTVTLGKSPPTALDPSALGKSCIVKHQSAVTFCIEQIDWPDELKGVVWVDTVMYQGLNAIVRYDNGVATRYHSLFPSASFREIVEYYIAKLGPPHNTWNRSVTPLAAPSHANPTVSWKALNPYTQVVAVLEIRQFDDTRGGFPDDKRGAIMLHNAQSGTIFPQVSAFELMRLRPL
jgi:hypothetical protein